MSKIYVTARSEKATKGQGGNSFVEVLVRIGSTALSRIVATLRAEVDGEMVHVKYTDQSGNGGTLRTFPLKGEQQKTDTP